MVMQGSFDPDRKTVRSRMNRIRKRQKKREHLLSRIILLPIVLAHPTDHDCHQGFPMAAKNELERFLLEGREQKK